MEFGRFLLYSAVGIASTPPQELVIAIGSVRRLVCRVSMALVALLRLVSVSVVLRC